jgi:hypothetical protein
MFNMLVVTRTNGRISVSLDGKPTALADIAFRAEVTAIGWRPWRNTIKIDSLSFFQEEALAEEAEGGQAASSASSAEVEARMDEPMSHHAQGSDLRDAGAAGERAPPLPPPPE